MKKLLSIILVVILCSSVFFTVLAQGDTTTIPREETLTYNGIQWGAATDFNPLNIGGNYGFGTDSNMKVIYESLYMYNVLTNENEPVIADGPVDWAEDRQSFTVKLKENVVFNDGEPMDADDVIWSFEINNSYKGDGLYTNYSEMWQYVLELVKIDEYTIKFILDSENYNPYFVERGLALIPIMPEHFWASLREEIGDDIQSYFNEETIATGPYKHFFHDDTRSILIRVDEYWGQAENMFGKLPAPKYIRQEIYQDNAAGNLAFSQGEVDVSQQFLPNIWELQATMDAPVKTYFPEKPYHLGYDMPSILFNLNQPGTDDYVVRKAIALSLDYDAIATNAMSGYMQDMIPSLYNFYLFGDYVDYEDEEVQALMWDTTDIDGNIAEANRMLDEAGYMDIDGDGLRELPDGSKIEWQVQCPYGWSDWNASLELLSESARKIGLNIVTHFPEFSEFNKNLTAGKFDIALYFIFPGPSVAMPWAAAYQPFYSVGVPPVGEVANRNFNRYKNERVDELIDLSLQETDPDILVEYYTELNKIWLSELPTVPMMYRPTYWHTVYEGFWTGFASADDGKNIPPYISINGAGIRELFQLEPVK